MHDRATPTYAPWLKLQNPESFNKLVIDKIQKLERDGGTSTHRSSIRLFFRAPRHSRISCRLAVSVTRATFGAHRILVTHGYQIEDIGMSRQEKGGANSRASTDNILDHFRMTRPNVYCTKPTMVAADAGPMGIGMLGRIGGKVGAMCADEQNCRRGKRNRRGRGTFCAQWMGLEWEGQQIYCARRHRRAVGAETPETFVMLKSLMRRP